MTKNFTIIAYYTDKYRDDAGHFMQSAARYGVPVYCEHVPDRGSWLLNTSFKPTFIRACFERIQNNLVYCDVDARFRGYPALFEELQSDIAFYQGNIWGRGHEEETLSGTVFLAHNKKVENFILNWQKACNNNSGEWDQRLIVPALPQDCVVSYLPIEYCAIFDSPKVLGKELVIEHLQHSRQHATT